MDLPFELHIALRYLLAKRKQAFISVISFVSTLGVTVGVMAVIIALAVMTGLQQTLRDRILGSQPHVLRVARRRRSTTIRADVEKLRAIPHVTGVAPTILGKALTSASRGQDFITVKGIDPALEPGITDVQRAMKSGSLAALARSTTSTGPDGIVLGQDLANTLGVSIGDSVELTTGEGRLSPLGMLPARRRLRVVGIFSLGLFEVRFRVRTRLDRRREAAVRSSQEVDYIQLHVDDIYAAPAIAHEVGTRLGDTVHGAGLGADEQGALLGADAREVRGVAGHRAHRDGRGAEYRRVADTARHREASRHRHPQDDGRRRAQRHGDLHAAGPCHRRGRAPRSARRWGIVISYLCDRYKLIRVSTDVYQISYLPFTVLALDFAVVVLAALAICFLATIYPSRQAARLDPAQALRYE